MVRAKQLISSRKSSGSRFLSAQTMFCTDLGDMGLPWTWVMREHCEG
jgi:hypothetical protein